MEKTRYQIARQVTLVSAFTNTLLAIGKVAVGYFGYSHALIADGLHSFSDLISDALVVIAAKAGERVPDEEHPYGHRRIETIGAITISLLLILVSGIIVYDAAEHIFSKTPIQLPQVSVLIVALISIVANEALYRYTRKKGQKINSSLLMANAWHHRGDALSSIIVFFAAGGAMLGLPHFDAVGAILIAILIFKMGLKMMLSGLNELIDTSVDAETLSQIRRVIKTVPGVVAIHQLRTRSHGGNILVDVHILVDPLISVSEGHHIGEAVHLALINEIAPIKDVIVHIDPEDDSQFMPSIALPSREEIEKILSERWKNLPYFSSIQRMTLHYLAGQLTVEVSLTEPQNEVPDLRKLTQEYVNAVSDLPEIADVIIHIALR